ncbi:MAG: metallophosphoesterase [Solirubrobacteraceae bacterium]
MTRYRMLIALVAGAVLAGCGADANPPAPGSTLRATLRDADGDGALERGPAEPLLSRNELGVPAPSTRTLATLGIIADAHVRDEESPARVPFLDRFGSPVDSAFRPQEALSAQVLDASVRAVRSQRPDAVIVAGDVADNAQANELGLALTVLRGGRAQPDSGAPGYDGVQRAGNADPLYYRPDTDTPRHPGLLARAQQPFAARGLDAAILPVMGNHDVLVQGELPPDARTREIATGDRMVTELRERPELPDGTSSGAQRVAAIRAILAGPQLGRSRRVAADPRRRELRVDEVVERLRGMAGVPGPSARLDYVKDVGSALRVLTLDIVDRAGGSGGVVSAAQVQWLRSEIERAGSRSVIVASHQPLRSSRGGEAARKLLDESPAVITTVSGHTHRHRIRPRRSASGGYWEIETASLADHPQQSRMLRLVSTRGGGRALESWVVDHDGAGLAGISRELAFLDVQGGRPRGLDASRRDRNVRLGLRER